MRVGIDNMPIPIAGSSVDAVTIAQGQVLASGAVVGRITESGKYAEFDPAADNGRAIAAGVLYEDVDASPGDVTARIVDGSCEVYLGKLVWKAGVTTDDQTAVLGDLARIGIKAR